jgi:hypothetical protein
MEIIFVPDDIPTPDRKALWQDKIDSLRAFAGKELTRWERDFLDDIESFLTTNGFLTAGQREKLDEIHSNHIPD